MIPGKHSVSDEIGEQAEKGLFKEADEVINDVAEQAQPGEGSGGAESGVDEEHAGVMAVLNELGLKGLIEGKALEGHWE
jgi:hypothetical protein